MSFNYNKDKANIIVTKDGKVKLRYHLSNKATRLQEINGKSFLVNREILKGVYNMRGITGVHLHVVTELIKYKMQEQKKKLSWHDKLKIWWYAR